MRALVITELTFAAAVIETSPLGVCYASSMLGSFSSAVAYSLTTVTTLGDCHADVIVTIIGNDARVRVATLTPAAPN